MATLGQVINRLEDTFETLQTIRDDIDATRGDVNEIRNITDQVNDRLEGISGDISSLTNSTTRIEQFVETGFANLSIGINDIIQINLFLAKSLNHLIDQNNTKICILEKISENTCNIYSESRDQTAIQQQMSMSINTIREIMETVHSEAYIDVLRRREIVEKVDKCCPPEEPRRACTYQECTVPSALSDKIPTSEHQPLRRPVVPEG